MRVGEKQSKRREDTIWSESGMPVRVYVVLGGRGRDGTMTVVGSWRKKREGVEGKKEKEGRSASCCLSLGG